MTRPLPATRRGASTTLVALALGGVALTGCAGSPAPAATSTSPVGSLIEQLVGEYDRDAQEKRNAEHQRAAEDLIAVCMAEQGFDYTPVDRSAVAITLDDLVNDPEAYAEKYGYGLSIEQEPTADQQAALEGFVDPNAAYMSAMTDSERAAYDLALYGDQSPPDPDGGASLATTGCSGVAWEQSADSTDRFVESEEFRALHTALETVAAQIDDDPRTTEAVSRWSACMSDRGFDYNTLDEPREHIYAEYERISPGDMAPPSGKPLEALQELETRTAIAEQACLVKVDHAAVRAAVAHDLETTFLEQNDDLVEALRTAHRELSGTDSTT